MPEITIDLKEEQMDDLMVEWLDDLKERLCDFDYSDEEVIDMVDAADLLVRFFAYE